MVNLSEVGKEKMGTFRVTKVSDSIYVVYTHNRSRYKRSTRVKVEDKYWNKSSGRVRNSHPNAQGFNQIITDYLQELINQVSVLRAQGLEPTIENLRKVISSQSKSSKHDFLRDYMGFLRFKESRVSKGFLKAHNQTYNLCKEYQEDFGNVWDINELNKEFFDLFVNFMLVRKELMESTVQAHVKRLKAFIRNTYPDFDLRFISFKPIGVYHDSIIYLYESEILFLKNVHLERGSFRKTRDLFLFCCLTGMRYGDSQRYDPAWEDRGILEFRMEKTGGKAYPPLNKTAGDVLRRWGGVPPKISGQKYNEYLKELFKYLEMDRMVPIMEKRKDNSIRGYKLVEIHRKLYDVISSHIARKTFISNALLKGISIQDVMKMSGHSDYAAMKPYIAISKKHLRDVSKLWDI